MSFDKHMNLHHAATHALRPFNAALRRVKEFGIEKKISDRPHAMLWLFQTCICIVSWDVCQSDLVLLVYAISEAWQWFQQPFAGRTPGVLNIILGIKSTSANWCVLQECAQELLQFYWFRSAVKFWNRMVSSNSNTLHDVIKADISLGNSGASNCWTRQIKDAFGDLQNGTVYRSDLLQCRKLNISICD